MTRCLFLAMLLLAGAPPLAAENSLNQELLAALGRDDCLVVPLWPEGAGPGETKPQLVEGTQKTENGILVFRPVVKPEMIIIPPPKGTPASGVTVLFCPGGGYGALETSSITQGSKWLNEIGATAVLLKYRVPRRSADLPAHHLPLMDAQRAMGLLRSRAKEWKLDPAKIGIIGFSAGGHLAAMASNHHDRRRYEPIDEHDRASCRPDFCLLIYPAYLTNPILELQADQALEAERMTPIRTPPTFVTVVRPDKFTIGCVNHFAALRKSKVPAELHVFSSGGHGGCFDRYPLLGWGYEAARFLQDHKFLDPNAVRASNAWLGKREAEVKKDPNTRIDAAGAARTAPQLPITSPQLKPADALEDGNLPAGDAELRRLLGPDTAIIPIWPKTPRSDDPNKDNADFKESTPTLPAGEQVLRIADVSQPTLTIMRAEKPDGRAVIVCPGGGYRRLAVQHEGLDAGRWLNEQGITVFVLKYRVPRREGVPVALQDVQRTISLVRSRAAEFGIDGNWIGVMGFSAGGHLAAESCHAYDQRSYAAVDEHDRASCKPSFGLLVYPAYLASKDGGLAEPFSAPRRNLTPPLFIAFAADDKLVEGSLPYVVALQQARVPVALHIYEAGGHGKGLRPAGYPFSRWTFAAERWLTDLTAAVQRE